MGGKQPAQQEAEQLCGAGNLCFVSSAACKVSILLSEETSHKVREQAQGTSKEKSCSLAPPRWPRFLRHQLSGQESQQRAGTERSAQASSSSGSTGRLSLVCALSVGRFGQAIGASKATQGLKAPALRFGVMQPARQARSSLQEEGSR